MAEKLKWETKKVKVKDLIELDINPRKISDAKKQKLIESLEKFNLAEIPAVNTDMQIIGGNQRVSALMMVGRGEEEIDVRVPNRKLTKKEVKEYAIISNTHAGEFDFEMLDLEFADISISEMGFEIEGWDDWKSKQDTLLAGEAQEDDFDATPPETPITVLGDLYEIGEHRLLCGDSTDSDQVAKLMNGEKADMVFTDPPYNVNYGNNNNPRRKDGDRSIKNDHMDGVIFRDFIQGVVTNIKLFCDGVVYCFGAQGADGRIMFTVLDENLHNSGTIIWLKDRLVLGRSKYHNKYEPCWFGWNKSGETFTDDRSLTNVFECKRPMKSDLHPTMKPIELIEMPLNHNPKAKSVLDLFLGSGSTMVASHQLNRKCYGMELDCRYADVIVKRMLKLDKTLKIKKNGIDETETWLKLIG